jgi:acylphosphatase
VQGVYFRQSARVEAKTLGIRGSAQNLPDGSVDVLAQGSAAAVEKLRVWLHHGPAHARVDEVREIAPDDAQPVPEGFKVI